MADIESEDGAMEEEAMRGTRHYKTIHPDGSTGLLSIPIRSNRPGAILASFEQSGIALVEVKDRAELVRIRQRMNRVVLARLKGKR